MARESFQELVNAVEHASSVKAAALVLIRQMGDKLTELATHPSAEELKGLADSLRQHADKLAEGIAEHDEGEDEGEGEGGATGEGEHEGDDT